MQTTAQPFNTQPASYTWFDAPSDYQNSYREVPRSKLPTNATTAFPTVATSSAHTNPNGSTVIQTETPTKHATGFMAKVENLTHRVGEHMGLGSDTATRWSLYQIPEPLFGEFHAKIVNGMQGSASGYLFISAGHLCFSSYTNSQNRAIKVIIPLVNIAHIGLAQRVKNASHTSGIVLTPLSSLSMRANALQVVTRDNVNHQFFGLRKNTENVFNLLTHSWSTANGQPLSGMAGHSGHAGPALGGNYTSMGAQQGMGHNPMDRNHDGRVDMRDLTAQPAQGGNYTTGGLVDSYQGSGLTGTTHYVNNTTSLTKEGLPLGSAPTTGAPLNTRLQ